MPMDETLIEVNEANFVGQWIDQQLAYNRLNL